MARKKTKKRTRPVVVAVSGGFDPIHVGHVRLFEHARKLGDKLVVILNNDNWLHAKKHHVFMPQAERKEVIEGLRVVDRVVVTSHRHHPADMTVSAELEKIKPDVFANGGDRPKGTHPPKEVEVCAKINCKMVFNVGHGGKVQSSSWLLEKYVQAVNGKKK